jgi:hypothetical protein
VVYWANVDSEGIAPFAPPLQRLTSSPANLREYMP